ncbi:MAG TPA: hemin uptake protein HemP [Stellaceae bacterium]|jgi:hemin uptake protein HemP|nr:hemin uptake protein HemP [Stellaceae bacterium]
MMAGKPPSSAVAPNVPAASAPEAQTPSISSEELLRGGRELIIRHRDDCYRLRLTGNDKLILVK